MLLKEVLSFDFLMTVLFDDLLLKFRSISPPFPIDRKSRMAKSTKKPLRLMSTVSVFFDIWAFAFDASSHGFAGKMINLFFTCVAFISNQIKMSRNKYKIQ